jgi:hypothetical protein
MTSLPKSQKDQNEKASSDMKGTPESHELSLDAIESATRATDAQRLSPTSLASLKLYLILLVPSMAGACVGFDFTGG